VIAAQYNRCLVAGCSAGGLEAMKAILNTSTGAGIADVDDPRPGGDEALVAVRALSINSGELALLENRTNDWRPGQDIAGVVVEAADNGSGPPPGTRVVALVEQAGWAELAAVSTARMAALPDEVTIEQAAALPLAGLTALRLLRAAGTLTGRRILITGASGGVGHYLTELAAGNGAQITAVTSSPERGRRLTELGATVVAQDLDLANEAGPYDLVLESVGGRTFTAALASLAPGGTVLWYGQASLTPVTLDFFGLFALTPFTLKHFPHWVSDTTDAQDLGTLVRLVETGRLHPEVGRTGDWAETSIVLDELNQRRVRGNAVLTIPTTG